MITKDQIIEILGKPVFDNFIEWENETQLEFYGKDLGRNGRKISIFIEHHNEDAVSYLRVWGVNIHTDMEDGIVDSVDKLKALNRWLKKEKP
jgi:hypothetical protein